MLALYLAVTEMTRNRLRFIVVFLIVALITLLVLFTAALGDGLAQSTSEFLDNLAADLIVFQADTDYQIPASRLGRSRLNEIRRVPGVAAVGPIGVSSATIIAANGAPLATPLDVALIGVEPRQPGAPAVFAGAPLADSRAAESVLDRHVVARLDLPIGTTITLKVVQGMEEQHYNLQVVGYTGGSKINFTPGIYVPLRRWEQIKPQERPGGVVGEDLTFNIAAIQTDGSVAPTIVAERVAAMVAHIAVTDPVTAYEATQGYKDMQMTLSLQQGFVLIIVVLIIGSFFQIQTLQKVAQIGMLEAIGASGRMVVATLLIQVMLTLLVGLSVGGAVVWLLARALPTGIPLVFSGTKIVVAILSILIAGPLAALVAVRTILQIEPLRALGLGA